MRFVRQPQARQGQARTGIALVATRAVLSCLAAFSVLASASVIASRPASAQSTNQNPAAAVNPFNLNLIAPVDARTGRPLSSFPQQKGGVLGGPVKKPDKAQPLLLEGDELIYDTKRNRVVARGNVQIYFDDYILTGDQITYDQNANTLTAEGNVQVREPNGNVLRGDKLITTDDFRDAFIRSLSLVGKDDTRIAARQAVRKDGNVTEFEQGKFTPCKSDPGKPPLWCVSAQRIVHDPQAASIVYQDAQFELLGVPVLWLPYFSHGDPSATRRTGVLVPEIANSSTLGTFVKVPYYVAVAQNADFLFQPTYYSTHGVLWQGDWRHKVALGAIRGEYTVKLAGIDQDSSTLPNTIDAATRAKLDGWRGSVQTTGTLSLSSWWRMGWDVTLESDDSFRRFYRLDGILSTSRLNQVYAEGISERNYFGARIYQMGGLLVQDGSNTHSKVMPVLDYNYIIGQPVFGGELSFNSNLTSLTRQDGTDSTRISADANWRRKFIDPIGQVITPFAQARGDVTKFTDGFDPDLGVGIANDTVTRAVGAAGVTYSYPFSAHSKSGSHVVEPIGQVIYRTASVSQRVIPNEDARSLVWDDTLLFDTDKFSGYDRIETGTRTNVGMQYTFQANSGGYARLIAGQSFHLAGENPYANPGLVPDVLNGSVGVPGSLVSSFTPNSGLGSSSSDYVLGAYLAPTENFKIVAQSRFDDQHFALQRANLFVAGNFGPLQLAGQYSFSRDDSQTNMAAAQQEMVAAATLKLTDRWAIGTQLRYDIDASLWLQRLYQIKYSDECFVLTATYTDNNISNPAFGLVPDHTVMLRFEFKHLGDYKYKTNILDSAFGTTQVPR